MTPIALPGLSTWSENIYFPKGANPSILVVKNSATKGHSNQSVFKRKMWVLTLWEQVHLGLQVLAQKAASHCLLSRGGAAGG